MDLHKSINAATARIQIAKLRRRDSSKRDFVAASDLVDEQDDLDGPSLDPSEALTLSSQKEFLEWMMDSKKRKENYTKEDVGALMEDAIDTEAGFLTTSYISFSQAQNPGQLDEFKRAGIFKKVYQHPKLCLYEIAKSCLTNGQHLSVKFFVTKFPLYRELHLIILLYAYNIIWEPRILFGILPLFFTYSAFAIMTAYSCRILISNLDLRFSAKRIIPLILVPSDHKLFFILYSRGKLLNVYAVFTISSLAYFISMPVSQAGSDLITAVCFLFFLLSIPILLLGSQGWLLTLTAILYIATLSPLQVLTSVLLTERTALFLVFACFVWVIWRNIGTGLSLRLSATVFFLLWGQAFVVSSQFTPLDGSFVQRLIIVVIVLFITITLRNYIFHLLVPSIAGVISSYYLPTPLACVLAFTLFTFSLLVSRFFARHRLHNWFLSLDPFEVTFSRVLWVVFILFIAIGVAQGILHSSHKLSKLDWDKYKARCTPSFGWEGANEAMYQLRCQHLSGRSVSLRGKVLSVKLDSRENKMEFYFNKLQVFYYLGDGLKCLFGQDTLGNEECDSWRGDFDQDICRYSKCIISLGAKYTFEIIFENFLDADTPILKIEASNYFRDEIIDLTIGEVIDVTAEILNPGSKSLNLKLKCIDKSQKVDFAKKCTSQLGISIPKLLKYLENLDSLIFNSKTWD